MDRCFGTSPPRSAKTASGKPDMLLSKHEPSISIWAPARLHMTRKMTAASAPRRLSRSMAKRSGLKLKYAQFTTFSLGPITALATSL